MKGYTFHQLLLSTNLFFHSCGDSNGVFQESIAVIKDIKIENFRGIASAELKDFGQLNLLVGKNNCGKTSVIEALYAVLAPNKPNLLHVTSVYRGLSNYKHTDAGYQRKVLDHSFKSLFFQLNEKTPIKFSAEFAPPHQKRDLEFLALESMVSSAGGTFSRRWIHGLVCNFSASLTDKKAATKKQNLQFEFSTLDQLKESTPNLSSEEALQEQDGNELPGMFFSNGSIEYFFLPSLQDQFDEIRKKNKKSELIKFLKKMNSDLIDVDFLEGSFHVLLESMKEFVQLETLGDGAKKFFGFACGLLGNEANLPTGSVILIDEIENGLHYSSLDTLWDWLGEIVKEKNYQIFATTHSMDCVESFSRLESNLTKRLYRLENNNKDGQIKVLDFDKEQIQRFLDNYYEIR